MDKKCTMEKCYPDYNVYPWLDLAEAFVIWQELCDLYSPQKALQKGTLFPELYKPYKSPYHKR